MGKSQEGPRSEQLGTQPPAIPLSTLCFLSPHTSSACPSAHGSSWVSILSNPPCRAPTLYSMTVPPHKAMECWQGKLFSPACGFREKSGSASLRLQGRDSYLPQFLSSSAPASCYTMPTLLSRLPHSHIDPHSLPPTH